MFGAHCPLALLLFALGAVASNASLRGGRGKTEKQTLAAAESEAAQGDSTNASDIAKDVQKVEETDFREAAPKTCALMAASEVCTAASLSKAQDMFCPGFLGPGALRGDTSRRPIDLAGATGHANSDAPETGTSGETLPAARRKESNKKHKKVVETFQKKVGEYLLDVMVCLVRRPEEHDTICGRFPEVHDKICRSGMIADAINLMQVAEVPGVTLGAKGEMKEEFDRIKGFVEVIWKTLRRHLSEA